MSSPAGPALPEIVQVPEVPAPPRRIFSDAAIQSTLDRALLSAPDGHTFAVVAHADLKEFVVVARLDRGPWSVAGYLKKEWRGGELEAGAELRFSA